MTEPRSERASSERTPPPSPAPRAGGGGRGGAAARATASGSPPPRPEGTGGGGGSALPPVAPRTAAAAAVATAARTDAPTERAAALWLTLSQRIAGRAAHELKNALNAVAVNLEVVRSRLARAAAEPNEAPQPSPAAAARFADVASHQFEAVSSLAEAILSMARAPREPADLVQLLAPLAVVFDAVARSDGGSLRVRGGDGGAPATVPVPAVAARLALAASLDAAVGRGRAVDCVVDVGAGTPATVRLSWLGAVDAPPVSAEIAAALRDCGVTIAPDESTSAAGAITIAFDDGATAAARSLGDAPPNNDQ